MKMRNAFTLIELLVVIAIIAVLMGILMPALSKVKENARRIVCAANLSSLAMGIQVYAAENDSDLPPCEFNGENGPHQSYNAYTVNVSAPFGEHITGGPQNLAILYETGIIKTPEVFYCPSAYRNDENSQSDTSVSWRFDRYIDDSGGWPWNNGHGTSWNTHLVRTGYFYTPLHARKKTVAGLPAIARKLTNVKAGSVMMIDCFQFVESCPHRRGPAAGINALYADGSVAFRRIPENVMADDAEDYQAGSGHLGNAEAYIQLVESLY
jgi:prepilin-type N-terminal cleavage/methylation domain-containing protein/prepilin-type processing-associated H-X9-DG protein